MKIFSFLFKTKHNKEKTINLLRSHLTFTINSSYDLYNVVREKNSVIQDLNDEFDKLQEELHEKMKCSFDNAAYDIEKLTLDLSEKDQRIKELFNETLDLKRQLKQHKNLIETYKKQISKNK